MNGIRCLIVPCVLATGTSVQAQQPDSVVVHGRLVEIGSGTTLSGQTVYVGEPWGRARATTDTSGAFSLKAAASDSLSFFVSCRVTRRPWGRTIGPFVFRNLEGVEPSPVEIGLAEGACREPRETAVEGTWSGHFSSGFEESAFEPCDPLPDLSNTAYGLEGAGVWVDFGAGARGVEWPPVPSTGGSSRYFVTLRGTRVGPGGYGHLGFSVYRILVDTVLVARPPRAGDCDGRGTLSRHGTRSATTTVNEGVRVVAMGGKGASSGARTSVVR